MSELHEVLAVEGDLKGVAEKTLQETAVIFSEKPGFFMGSHKQYHPFEEDDRDLLPVEHSELTTTVNASLEFCLQHVYRYWDAVYQKEATNQIAKADIIIDGKTLLADIPATFLLGMETKLKGLRKVFEAIPTLQPGIKWIPDPDKGKDIYASEMPVEKFRTKKVPRSVRVAKATEHHPEQATLINEDITIGKTVTNAWSGMITPKAKTDLLGRLDKLLRAVKQARQRANKAEAITTKVGKEFRDYILQGK